jgi:hypothetical protein
LGESGRVDPRAEAGDENDERERTALADVVKHRKKLLLKKMKVQFEMPLLGHFTVLLCE